jgi:long-chain fatty acid transport protein
MKRIVVCAATCALLAASAAPALATNGYQLIGVGQAEKGMAGAVTASPLDTMTAITNPAGMAVVGERADFSMEAFMPHRRVDFSASGGGSTDGGSELYGIPSVGWVAKAFRRDDMYFGGGMFATSGLGVDYDQVTMAPAGAFGASGPVNPITFTGYSAIQFWKMAPTLAWRASEATSLGVSLNVDYQSLTMVQRFNNIPFYNTPPGTVGDPTTDGNVVFDLGRPTNQMGFGASIGVLHEVTDTVTVGASYTTKQQFPDGQYRLGTGDLFNYNGATGMPGTYKLALDYPQQAAVGVAVTPTQRFLVDFDIKWIDWSSTHDKVDLKGPAGAFNAAQNPTGSTTSTQLDFGWRDQWVYALGVQYAATDALKLRAGFNYAKSPIDSADVFNNIIFPALVERHLTLGVDYRLGDHWGIGGTYMRAFKKTLTGTNDVPGGFQQGTPFGASSGTKISLDETSVGLLLSYRF